jgi:hypothetical protein
MRFAKCKLAILGLLAFPWLGEQPAGGASELATVRLVLSSTLGKPLGRALAVLKAIGPSEEYRQSGDPITFPRVPFGLYDLEIYASGFATLHQRVGIYNSEVRLRLGLYVSQLGPEDQRPEVAGSIKSYEKGQRNLWVRLVPWYSGDFVEDQVAPSGEFCLRDVHPGRYVLLVFDSEKLLITKQVEYTGGRLSLNLDLAN